VTLVDDVLALARTPAPTFGEGARLDWLERRLEDAPGARRRDAAGNLVWSWGEGRPQVVVAAHVDTVFPADTPLEIRREGDALVGPGVGDNAAAVAVAVAVVERLLAAATLAPGAVVFTVAEEGLGNLGGARAACEELEPAAFIALEGHLLESVLVDAVGSVRARMRVQGPGGHSWSDRGSPSAIHALLDLAAALRDLGTGEAPVNVGLIGGGRSVNAIADAAEAVVERRAVEQAPLDAFVAALDGLHVDAPLRLEVERLGDRPGGSLPRDAPLLAAALAAREALGLPLATGAGSTDANAALARGIPALCLGVSYGSGMHSLDERIDAPSLELGAAQLEHVLRLLLTDGHAIDGGGACATE
jgi:tripeptide aminopeptidase